MTSSELIVDAFGRIRQVVHKVVEGLSSEQLSVRLDGRANSIAWLVWHLTRVQDDHVAEVADVEQVWTSEGWVDRFALPFDPSATGFGHSSSEVDAVTVESGGLLTAYHDAVYGTTIRFVERLTDDDLNRIVDESWDPPVSLGVRLISVVSDDFQHAGQAAMVKGLL